MFGKILNWLGSTEVDERSERRMRLTVLAVFVPVFLLLYSCERAAGQQLNWAAALPVAPGAAAPVEPALDWGEALSDGAAAAPPLTYEQARALAIQTGKPFVVWTGKAVCPGCIEATKTEWVNFASAGPLFGFFPADSLTLCMPKAGDLVFVESAQVWGQGHLPTLRAMLRKWDARQLPPPVTTFTPLALPEVVGHAGARRSATYSSTYATMTYALPMTYRSSYSYSSGYSAPPRRVGLFGGRRLARGGGCSSGG